MALIFLNILIIGKMSIKNKNKSLEHIYRVYIIRVYDDTVCVGTRRILTTLRLLLAPADRTPINKFSLSREDSWHVEFSVSPQSPNNK